MMVEKSMVYEVLIRSFWSDKVETDKRCLETENGLPYNEYIAVKLDWTRNGKQTKSLKWDKVFWIFSDCLS